MWWVKVTVFTQCWQWQKVCESEFDTFFSQSRPYSISGLGAGFGCKACTAWDMFLFVFYAPPVLLERNRSHKASCLLMEKDLCLHAPHGSASTIPPLHTNTHAPPSPETWVPCVWPIRVWSTHSDSLYGHRNWREQRWCISFHLDQDQPFCSGFLLCRQEAWDCFWSSRHFLTDRRRDKHAVDVFRISSRFCGSIVQWWCWYPASSHQQGFDIKCWNRLSPLIWPSNLLLDL